MRMQQTSSVQQNEVQRYLSQRSETQASERQKQRALLGSDTLRSDKASVTMCRPSSSTNSSQIHESSGPYELSDAYNRSFHGSCLMGHSVQPPSTSGENSPSSTKTTRPAELWGSSVSSSMYETLGRGSSSTSLSTGFGSTDKSAATSTTELQPWICTYCANKNNPVQDIHWRCSRCGNDRIGVFKYEDSTTVARR